ncbi:MAG: hypothetical protein OXG15_00270, partial [Gammaproteobacteria bacterium]|nr:hypothetical protein [Gammaproteobacteria bacterium]
MNALKDKQNRLFLVNVVVIALSVGGYMAYEAMVDPEVEEAVPVSVREHYEMAKKHAQDARKHAEKARQYSMVC